MGRNRSGMFFKALLTGGLLGAAGCSPATGSGFAGDDVASTAQEITVPDPNGAYFANVVANGTGCPRDTWTVDVDPSGQTFTLTFSAYDASVEPGQVISIKDCQIGVKLHSPNGLSWAVDDFYYSGYAFLSASGMIGTQTAGYYFQGNPIDSTKERTDLVGPYDDDFVFADEINIPDLVWSACGTDRMLNIPTRLIVRNNAAKSGTGYMNTLAVDGSVQLVFNLRWRSCP